MLEVLKEALLKEALDFSRLLNFRKKPSKDIIPRVASQTNGYITVGVLVHLAGMTVKQAEKQIVELFKKGRLELKNHVTNSTSITEWVCLYLDEPGSTEQTMKVLRGDNINLDELTKDCNISNAAEFFKLNYPVD